MFDPKPGILAAVLARLRLAGRQAALAVAVGVLAAFGLVSLMAASFAGLIPVLGLAGALALNGLALLFLALGAMALTRPAPPPPLAEPPKGAAIDLMVQLAFDLSYLMGERLARPRR